MPFLCLETRINTATGTLEKSDRLPSPCRILVPTPVFISFASVPLPIFMSASAGARITGDGGELLDNSSGSVTCKLVLVGARARASDKCLCCLWTLARHVSRSEILLCEPIATWSRFTTHGCAPGKEEKKQNILRSPFLFRERIQTHPRETSPLAKSLWGLGPCLAHLLENM